MIDRPRFSLHSAAKAKMCEVCDVQIPVGGEWWKAKGRWPTPIPRVICVLCHYMFGFPDDGWIKSPDGREVMAASVPHERSVKP